MILSQLSQPLSQLPGATVLERQSATSVNHSVTTVTSVRAFSFWCSRLRPDRSMTIYASTNPAAARVHRRACLPEFDRPEWAERRNAWRFRRACLPRRGLLRLNSIFELISLYIWSIYSIYGERRSET